MASYTLIADIAKDQIGPLTGYRLCIAKKTVLPDGIAAYNVIWNGVDIFPTQTFSWEESYQVYGSNPWVQGAEVQASTNVEAISFGQNCIIKDNIMQPATGTPDDSGIFTVSNHDGQGLTVGVSILTGTVYLPFYVTPTDVLQDGRVTLHPLEEIVVGFDQSAVAGMMLESIEGPSITLTYPLGTTTMSVKYEGATPGGGHWTVI